MEKRKTRAPGAGVKADDGTSSLARKQVRLDKETVDVLTKVGGDNLSLGIREAARRIVEASDIEPFSAKRHANRLK